MPGETSYISYQVVLGDSLTDGGELKHSKPLLARASDLNQSPYGRFTNGYTWADDVARSAALDILKEQFIAYILNAVQPEKLNNPEIAIAEFKQYIRAIDLEKFHPDTFSFEKLKDSYLKRHLVKENILSYCSNLDLTHRTDDEQGAAFINYLQSLDLETFHPDTFDFQQLLSNYAQKNPTNESFISCLNGMINPNTIANITIAECKERYTVQQNIFDAIDFNRFSVNHLNENLKNFLYGSFSLGDYQRTLFQGHNFFRRFAEGGLSASHYWPVPDLQTLSLILKQVRYTLIESHLSLQYIAQFVGKFFSLLVQILGARATLSYLDEQANCLLKDDKAQNISTEQKKHTLITEWTGANDFMTMEAIASEQVCDNAVKSRKANILKLAKEGYQHFLLIELPDLGKTPRYLGRTEKERAEVSRLVDYFNTKLSLEINTLQEEHPELSIKLFPLHDRFDAIYDNPSSFGLSKDINKLNPLISALENVNQADYMFWDDVHPSNQMHHVLAQEVYKFAKENYCLQPPAEISSPCCPVDIAKGLLVMFKDKYSRSYKDYQNQMIGGISRFFWLGLSKQPFENICFAPEHLNEAKQSLAKLYVLSKNDKIVKQSMIDLGWLQKNGDLPNDIAPLLEQSYKLSTQFHLENPQPLPETADFQHALP